MNRKSNMRTKIDGIQHFHKLMNHIGKSGFLSDKFINVDKNTFINCMDQVPYMRDWWGDCILYVDQRAANERIYGVVKFKTVKYLPQTYYISKEHFNEA